ncbi:MAG: ATP-binding protein [bacterium]
MRSKVCVEETSQEIRQLRAEVHTLRQLLEVHERSVIEQSCKLEQNMGSLQLMQFSIDHASIIAMIVGSDGGFLYANEAASQSLGYSLAGLLSMKLCDINPWVTENAWENEWEKLKQLGSFSIATEYKTRYGSALPVEVTYNYLKFKDGEYICVFARDITERKQAEKHLQKAYDELEDRVDERTLELKQSNEALQKEAFVRKRMEEKLKLSASKLVQSNQEIRYFLYIASHHLQEPIRKAMLFGDRLQNKYGSVLGDEAQNDTRRMKTALMQMQNLMNDLRTYARVTIEEQPFVPVDLSSVSRGVLSDLKRLIQETGGRVEVGDLATIEADPSQIQQLLQNIIVNALKFHKEKEPPVIRIHGRFINGDKPGTDDHAPANKLYELTVEDNGIGFNEKYNERIFGVFQRLHAQNEYEGTGIGLSICRKIVERHHGTITAESKPGQGSTFFITLPVLQHGRESDDEEISRVCQEEDRLHAKDTNI